MNNKNVDLDELLDEEVDTIYDLLPNATLTLHNDDFNTFEHVIFCLVRYCNHSLIQAEQCALIVHNNGRCNIKSGDYQTIFLLYKKLLGEGLIVTLEVVP